MLPFPSFIVPLLLLASVSVLAIWDQAGDVTIASVTDGKYLSNVYFEIPAGAAGYGETQWDGSGKELQYRAAGGDGKLWQKFRPMKGLPPSDPEAWSLPGEAKFEVKFDKPVEDFGNPSCYIQRATEDIGRNNVFMVKAAPSYLYPCHFEDKVEEHAVWVVCEGNKKRATCVPWDSAEMTALGFGMGVFELPPPIKKIPISK